MKVINIKSDIDSLLPNPGTRHFLLLLGFWIIAAVIVNPAGEFPLNDDWAFAQNVKILVEEGRLVFNEWMTMTLIVQMLWGALFCKIFGFSFTLLRISTLILAFTATWATYLCLKFFIKNPENKPGTKMEERLRSNLAFLAGLVLAANPLFFSLSFTFMTDVPFLAFFILSNVFFLRAFRDDRWSSIIWGTVFATLAVLIRQFGLLSPLAFGLAYFMKKPALRTIPKALLPIVVSYPMMTAWLNWLTSYTHLPLLEKPGSFLEIVRNTPLLTALYNRMGFILFYLGLFLLPVLIFFIKNKSRSNLHTWLVWTSAIVIGVITAIPAWPHIPIGNIWYDLGLGPAVLKDTFFTKNMGHQLPENILTGIKIAGFGGAILLLKTVLEKVVSVFQKDNEPVSTRYGRLFVFFMKAAYGLFLIYNYHFFDRYILLLFPIVLLAITPSIPPGLTKIRQLAAIMALLLMGIFSIAATHDYLAWNRARWQALNYLTDRQKISPDRIDGGFEFNGWHNTHPRNPIFEYGKSWYFVDNDEYAVTTENLDCYQVKKAYFYPRYLPPTRDSILLLRRIPVREAYNLTCNAEHLTPDSTALTAFGEYPAFGGGARQSDEHSHSGRFALKLDSTGQFGFSQTFTGVAPCEHYEISVWQYAPRSHALIVVSAANPEDLYIQDMQTVAEKDSSDWEKLHLELTLPGDFPGDILKIYLWNPHKEPVWVDDVRIVRKKYLQSPD